MLFPGVCSIFNTRVLTKAAESEGCEQGESQLTLRLLGISQNAFSTNKTQYLITSFSRADNGTKGFRFKVQSLKRLCSRKNFLQVDFEVF